MAKEDAGKLAKDILANLIARLGKAWDSLTEKDKDLLMELTDDYAGLFLQALTDPNSAKIKQARKEVEASLKSLASIKASQARTALHAAVRDAVKSALGLIVAVA